MKGTIARRITDKGFGFIDGEDGVEYFFHRSRMLPDAEAFDTLGDRQAVTFTPDEGPKGKRAKDIQVTTA